MTHTPNYLHIPLDLPRFFDACNPSRTIDVINPDERRYYIDFSPVRGGKIIEELQRTIILLSPNKPTCQLFTGHIGCGKSTELLRLKAELEQYGFHVVYFESTQDLDMADVDVTDILLAITHEVSESLEAIGIQIRAGYFANLINEIQEVFQTPIEFRGAELSLGIAKLTAATRSSPNFRRQVRQYLEPRTSDILQSINKDVLESATAKLKKRGQKGLVVIVDNLDRVDPRPKTSGRSQPEYLFIDRGDQLRQLKCHVVYTIPLSLIFSNESEVLTGRLGGGVPAKMLPMVPVQFRDGRYCEEGMALLKQMVLARAFPDIVDEKQRFGLVREVFESPETLERLCCISGGHVRKLLGLLCGCIQQENPPLSRDCLENVILADRDRLLLAITDDEWELLFRVVKQQIVSGEAAYQTLLRSLFVFEYQDRQGRWFGINPVLKETAKFKSWQQRQELNHG